MKWRRPQTDPQTLIFVMWEKVTKIKICVVFIGAHSYETRISCDASHQISYFDEASTDIVTAFLVSLNLKLALTFTICFEVLYLAVNPSNMRLHAQLWVERKEGYAVLPVLLPVQSIGEIFRPRPHLLSLKRRQNVKKIFLLNMTTWRANEHM